MKLQVVRSAGGRKRYVRPTVPVLERATIADRVEEIDLLLSGTVGDVRAVVESGEWDNDLHSLLAYEGVQKNRKGVREAIEERILEISEDTDDA